MLQRLFHENWIDAETAEQYNFTNGRIILYVGADLEFRVSWLADPEWRSQRASSQEEVNNLLARENNLRVVCVTRAPASFPIPYRSQLQL